MKPVLEGKRTPRLVDTEDGKTLEITKGHRQQVKQDSDYFFEYIMHSLVNFETAKNKLKDKDFQLGLDFLESTKPNDEVEAILLTQVLQAAKNIDLMLNLAIMPEQTATGTKNYMTRYFRGVNSLCKLVDTLSRYKKKGEQKVTVMHQHVNVSENSQAIIGDVSK